MRKNDINKHSDMESAWVAGYDALACAIVRAAYIDYQLADKKLKKAMKEYEKTQDRWCCDKIRSAMNTKDEVIKFFRSKWYSDICSIDPERIIAKLREEESA